MGASGVLLEGLWRASGGPLEGRQRHLYISRKEARSLRGPVGYWKPSEVPRIVPPFGSLEFDHRASRRGRR
eukprot:4864810-Pyramimonas_sp.AAC.1